jgi:hypothetical protein
MRKIKSFRMFEARHWPTVPAHFIPLNSIGHYLDPEEGCVYAMLKAGGYEDEPYDAAEEFDEESEAREQLSEEEWEKVESVWKDAQGIIEPALDWDFISDIKDIALSEEILDKGYYLRIRAKLRHLKDPVIYCEWYGHDKDDVWYPRLFQKAYRDIQQTERLADSIVYELCVLRSNGPGGFMPVSKTLPEHVDMVRSLMSRIGEMDPKMFSRLEYANW